MSRTTRRTLVRGAAWTAPVTVIAAAAPAYAGSQGCVAGQAAIPTTTSPVTALTFPPSAVTATVTYSTTTYPGGTVPTGTGMGVLNINATPPFVAILLLQSPQFPAGAAVTMRMTLSEPVTNLSLFVDSIGRGGSFESEWADLVVVDTPGYTVTERAASIAGSGTAADPLRSTNSAATVADVTLVWAGPVSEVQLTYVAGADVTHPFGQDLAVAKIGFTC